MGTYVQYAPEGAVVPSGVVAARVGVELCCADVGVDDVTGEPLPHVHAVIGVYLDAVSPDNVAVAPGLAVLPLQAVVVGLM